MKTDEKYAKLLALSVLYGKDNQIRNEQVKLIYCQPEDIPNLLKAIKDNGFKQWVASVSHLFRPTNQ